MANIYVNFDLASGGDGSSGDPYGCVEFWANFPISVATNIWYARGTLVAATTNLTINNNVYHYLYSWDTATYGPFRMKIQDIVLSYSVKLVYQYGIVECRDINCVADYTQASVIFARGSYLRVSRNIVQNAYNFWAFESTVVVDGTWATGSFQIDSRNSVFIGTPSAAITLVSANSKNSCCSASSTLMKGTSWANSQFSWTPPASLPYYDSARADFNYSKLNIGINTPPQPGNLPTYNLGLWGDARTGIGGFDFGALPPYVVTNVVTKLFEPIALGAFAGELIYTIAQYIVPVSYIKYIDSIDLNIRGRHIDKLTGFTATGHKISNGITSEITINFVGDLPRKIYDEIRNLIIGINQAGMPIYFYDSLLTEQRFTGKIVQSDFSDNNPIQFGSSIEMLSWEMANYDA